MNTLENKIKGLLIGCACGDAMGMPSEMMSMDTFHNAFPEGIHTFEPSSSYDFMGRHFQAGQVTDDTINTLLVCDTIIEGNGSFDLSRYLGKLTRWIEDNAQISSSVIGPSTAKALKAIQQGIPVTESGKFGTTNGAAMKISPLGIINSYTDMDALINNVHQLCLPTHNTTIAVTGASIIAALVSFSLRENVRMKDLWNLAFAVIEKCDNIGNPIPSPFLAYRLQNLHDYMETHTEAETLEYLQTAYGTGMETIETLPAVMTLLAVSHLDPLKCAATAANLSGDTDTIGSIATAICGAIHPDFPQEIVQLLEEVNHIDFGKYAKALAPLCVN